MLTWRVFTETVTFSPGGLTQLLSALPVAIYRWFIFNHIYHKQQILCGTKLSPFTGFLAECRENCRGFVKLQYIFERAIEISRENFHVLSKMHENRESFVSLRICCLQ